jgi:tRNA1Val (adenine37-N6)-methyltransferase
MESRKDTDVEIGPDETLDRLFNDTLTIVQKKEGYRFSVDAILLANFVTIKKNERILDIGSGCGIIPIYMSVLGIINPIVGMEIQDSLFEVSLKNRALNRCEHVQFLRGDINREWKSLKGQQFQVIVSNPPYTRDRTGRRSPGESRAIARHESHLALTDLLSISSALLEKGGRLALIYPSKRLGEIVSGARDNRLEVKRLRFVHPRRGEDSNLMLAEFVKDGGIGTTVHQPLYIYDHDGYTGELRTYYFMKG